MKKILFATTALIATAGVAAAEVSFGGYGRFGIRHLGGPDTQNIITRLRLQIDMSTEADNGLTFGARLRMQQDVNGGVIDNRNTLVNNGGTVNSGFNGARIWARTGGFEMAVGNIFGAIEIMPANYAGSQSGSLGLTGLSYSDNVTGNAGGWDAYDSRRYQAAAVTGATYTTRDAIELRYSAGDFSGHLSYSESPAGAARTAIHAAYTFSGWTVALGYQDSDTAGEDILALTASGTIGNFDLEVGISDVDGPADTRFVVRGGMDVGAATRVYGHIAMQDAGTAEDAAYGLAVSHSLGGGASIEAGVENDFAGNTNADLGIRFNF